jgi:hypothetical protein
MFVKIKIMLMRCNNDDADDEGREMVFLVFVNSPDARLR